MENVRSEKAVERLFNYQFELFFRCRKRVSVEDIATRLCLRTDNPLVECIWVSDFVVTSTSMRQKAGRFTVNIDVSMALSVSEVEAISADICQQTLHPSIKVLAPVSERFAA